MLKAQVYKGSKIIEKIRDFYLLLYQQRLYSNAKYKYPRSVAERNIRNTLSFIGKEFNNSELRRPINSQWARNGWYEIKYNNWHFAVVVQLDLFGNNIAIIQDCAHDKDYHNDTMQTEPFKMDSPNDQSHLVDWKLHKLRRIIAETINDYLRKNLIPIN